MNTGTRYILYEGCCCYGWCCLPCGWRLLFWQNTLRMKVAVAAAYLAYKVAVAVAYLAYEVAVAVAYLAYEGCCCLTCAGRLLLWQPTLRMKVAVAYRYLAYDGCYCGSIPYVWSCCSCWLLCEWRLLLWLTLRMNVAVAYLAYEGCCCCLPCVWR